MSPICRLWTPALLVLICIVALVVRVAAADEARGHAVRADEFDYVIPAEGLTRTGVYRDTFQTEGRTWTRVPLHGLLLAAAFATQPAVPPGTTVGDTGLMAARFAAGQGAEILVSLLLVPLVMILAAEAFPARRRPAALLAGALVAVYPPLVHSAGTQLLSETLFITLNFATLWLLTRWQPGPRGWPWLLGTGIALGLTALARPVAVAFVPFVGLWLLGGGRLTVATLRRAIGGGLLVTAGLFAAISPWTLYNYQAYGRLILLDTANVTAFWHYNNYSGEDENALLEALPNPADRQALILRKGVENILAHPDRFARNVADSLGYAWHLELQSALLPNAWDITRRDADVPDVLPTDAAFVLVSLLGLAGMAGLGGGAPTDKAGRVRRALLWWIACTLLLGAIIPYDARYRMPAAPALIIFAAGLLVTVQWRRVADPRRWAAIGRTHPLVIAITAALCAWVILGAAAPSIPPALHALALHWQAEHANNPAQAAALHEEAIAALPDSYWPRRAAADAARLAGEDDRARQFYTASRERGGTDDPRGVLGFADLVNRHPDWTLTGDETRWLAIDPNELRGAPWNSFAPTPRARVTLGLPGDLPYQQGFQGGEQAGNTPFCWSAGRGMIRLPAGTGAPPATLVRLRLAVPPVGPPGPWTVTVRVAGAAPVPLTLTAAWADYTVPLDPPITGLILLTLDSPVRSPHAYDPASPDRRLLGVGVQWAEREP